jgi:putative heme iron utilization protein
MGKHYSGSEPSLAEQARSLMDVERTGTLATHSTRHAGFPFASLMPYGSDSSGQPTFFVSRLAVHTQNLERNSRASLLVSRSGMPAEALRSPRLSLLGNVTRVIDDGSVRDDYVERHPETRPWLGFSDFGLYRMEVLAVYYVAGFGDMGWVSAEDYRHAHPDPLAKHRVAIVDHMNADHADALLLYSRAYAEVEAESAVMEDVDRLGLRLHARDTDGEEHDLRINFLREVRTPQEARAVLVEMVRQARQRLGVEQP